MTGEIITTGRGGEIVGADFTFYGYESAANPARIYIDSLRTEVSKKTMEDALDRMAGIIGDGFTAFYCPWHMLSYAETNRIKNELVNTITEDGTPYAPATVNKHLCALRRVLEEAWNLKLMTTEDYHRARRVKGFKLNGKRKPAGRYVPEEELIALLDTCDTSVVGVRDAAIISILYSCGLRRAELVTLDLADYDETTQTLNVKGKGGAGEFTREQPVINGAIPALADWLTVRGDQPGPLFWGAGNRQSGERLTVQAIYNMLRRRAKRAGVESLSPHDLRRSFATDLINAGNPIGIVKDLMGHSSVTTTDRYHIRGQEEQRKAAARLHVPYKKRVLSAE